MEGRLHGKSACLSYVSFQLADLVALPGLTSRSGHYSIKGRHLGSPLAMPRTSKADTGHRSVVTQVAHAVVEIDRGKPRVRTIT